MENTMFLSCFQPKMKAANIKGVLQVTKKADNANWRKPMTGKEQPGENRKENLRLTINLGSYAYR